MNRDRLAGLILWRIACALFLLATPRWSQTAFSQDEPLATEDRLQLAGWWPTKTTPHRDEYVGPAVCAECHAPVATVQQTTPMARACARAADSKTLQENERITSQLGSYSYEIARSATGSLYSVRDGAGSISTALGWVFGEGEWGQTFVFARAGILYEGQFSYFPALHELDITPGHSHSAPPSLEAALGRALGAAETYRCFACHNTASSTSGHFDPDHMIPGVTCEACHGPGAKHVAAMRAGRARDGLAAISNPAKLAPVDSVDFCGACHHTWADVVQEQARGIATVRFQPYRLELSRCWGGKGSSRITCLSCHHPHQPLARDASSYDGRCLQCHAGTKGEKASHMGQAPACPRGTRDCVKCHMPKYEVPDTHAKFTDHWIRVVQSDRHYPD